jgi:uncharacterized protein
MNPIKLENLTVFGELAMRAQLNYARLETERYWPETIFEMDQHAWPADWEGRTMLALTMHARLSGRMPAFLDDIVDRIPGRLNERGYIGPVYPDGVTHEQAMSGHSWMIRALVEYHRWRKPTDPKRAAAALDVLKSIIENLYLPQTDNYRDYPIDEATRYDDPRWILSHKQTKTKSHAGTSDCGCAFIAIDGATAALELLGDPRLHALIEAMIASYEKLPRQALHVQTHATLSGVRGILRYHRITGEKRHLEFAIRIFDLYKSEAWTDHYANYNWFGLPRWTEPCAIVDSFIISQELWEMTGEEGYLRDGHHILYNAIAHAERCNGAFGTDLCVGAKVKPPSATGGTDSHACDEAIIFAKALTYEVFWCCNMRGGDGLANAAMYSLYHNEDSVTFPYYHNCVATLELQGEPIQMRVYANYPFEGKVVIDCLQAPGKPIGFRFFAPDGWTSGGDSRILLNGNRQPASSKDGFIRARMALKPGDQIILETNIHLNIADGNACRNNSKDHHSFRHGPMMLGVKSSIRPGDDDPAEVVLSKGTSLQPLGTGRYRATDSSGNVVVLQPLWGKENLSQPEDSFQVLFRSN